MGSGVTPVRRRLAVASRRSASGLRAAVGGATHAVRRRLDPDGWTVTSPHRVLLVPAASVGRLTATRLPEELRGRRVEGDWDLTAIAVDTTALAGALRRRFIDGVPWEACGLLEAGAEPEVAGLGERYRTMTDREAARRMATLDALHASLQRDGWRPHHEVGAPLVREMAVCVGRDGRLIRNRGGLHRLIIARLLGLDAIPVRLLAEHAAAPVRPLAP